MKQRIGHLTGHHIGLVLAGHRDHHVGIFRPGTPQDIRVSGMSIDRSQIKPVFQRIQALMTIIHDGNVIGLPGQVLGHRGTHLPCTQYDDLHSAAILIPKPG